MATLCICVILCTSLTQAFALPEVAPVDLSGLSPDDFADDELDVPYLLEHFHTIANSVVQEGDNRGFIDISVWRRKSDNKPYNARVMENHLAFAWFYCTDRPWNPYYADPAVRAHLEAVLDFWCRMQNDDGRFSEYKAGGWNLPATAFATKFMGQTLTLLADGPPIDPDLHQRVIDADRRAIMATLTRDDLYRSGRYYSNQFSNVWGGAAAFVALFDDNEVQGLLEQRMRDSMDDFQSPAGYFYEGNGPDWSYNMGTHHSNLRMAWHYLVGTEMGDLLEEKERRWFEWLAWNAPMEPDGSQFVLNRAIETRQSKRSFSRLHSPLAEHVPVARAFSPSREERAESIRQQREALEEQWPEVPELNVGSFSAYSPYSFLHRDHRDWYPTAEERDVALDSLPRRSSERRVHQRMDSRLPMVFTYVRRPGYYAALNTGEQARDRERFGLGLVWTPQSGAALQSQTGGNATAWGTAPAGAEAPVEAASFTAAFEVDGEPVRPQVGARDLPDGVLTVRYPLGEAGEKTLTFADDAIIVEVEYEGAFTEHLPLLSAEEALSVAEDGTVPCWGMVVSAEDCAVEITATDTKVAGKRLHVITLSGEDSLTYRLDFAGAQQ